MTCSGLFNAILNFDGIILSLRGNGFERFYYFSPSKYLLYKLFKEFLKKEVQQQCAEIIIFIFDILNKKYFIQDIHNSLLVYLRAQVRTNVATTI